MTAYDIGATNQWRKLYANITGLILKLGADSTLKCNASKQSDQLLAY